MKAIKEREHYHLPVNQNINGFLVYWDVCTFLCVCVSFFGKNVFVFSGCCLCWCLHEYLCLCFRIYWLCRGVGGIISVSLVAFTFYMFNC